MVSVYNYLENERPPWLFEQGLAMVKIKLTAICCND